MKYILTIAGSDSCGGAGIQADIKTITALHSHALTAITAVTAQNSMGISEVYEMPGEFIARQINTVAEDIIPDSVKIGMLSSSGIIEAVAGSIIKNGLKKIVIDPVMKASTGRDLMDASALNLLRDVILPLSDVITPNLHEAEVLTGARVRNPSEMEAAARELKKMGPDVIITGGHLDGDCIDLLYDGNRAYLFQDERIKTENTHGTGCVFSSSLACFLAQGKGIIEAAGLAHDFTRRAIAQGYPCGRGPGPVSPAAISSQPIN